VIRKLIADAQQLATIAGPKGAPPPSGVKLIKLCLATDSYQITAASRMRDWARARRVPGVNHLLRVVQTAFFGIELGKDVILGHGIWFIHPLGIVIGGNAKVGDRVRFFGNNTVGTAKENGYPTIEDDVWVGAGARILGPVRVGARSVIGANAVVVTDIPPDSIAVGVPAKFRPKPKEVAPEEGIV
jgi:serine O-acetyltransferase